MPAEANKAIVRRFYEEDWNRGNLDAADAIFAADYVRHDLRPGAAPPGPAGQKAVAGMFRAAFPDVHLAVELLVAEGEYVVARWTMAGTHRGAWGGVAPTSRRVEFAG
jgi:predicted ester cyclase